MYETCCLSRATCGDYLGVFFVGAYQKHSAICIILFAVTNVVTVELQDDGRFELMHEQEGDTVAEVLTYVGLNRAGWLTVQAIVERAVHEGAIALRDQREMIDAFKDGINGYTYFEH